MQNILLFAVLGLGEGALIAALAMSVVVFYRGSGTVNLSMGAMAMVGSYLFYSVNNAGALGFRPPWWLAFIIVLVFVAILGTIIEFGLFWPLRGSSPLAKLAASLGLLLLAQAIIAIAYGNNSLSPTSVLPSNVFHLFDAVVPVDRMILAGIAIVLGIALWALYRFTQFGLATRAAAESERYAMYAGVSPRRLSLTNSLIASVIAGAVGILVAPLITLNTTTLPLEIVPALGAALFAGFSSLGVACFAGLLMGAGASLLNYWASQSWFPQSQGNPLNGLAELLFFVLVAIAMFWRGSKVPARGEVTEKRMPLAPRPEKLTRYSVIGLVVGVVLLIILPYEFRQAMVNSMLGAMICLSLIVVIGYVGQISVVQVGLAGVTGYAMSHMLVNVGGVWADFPLAPLIGIGCALIVGFITAVASLRVRGVSLAVVTLAGMYAIENFGFGNAAWGQQNSGSPVNPLHIFGINLSPSASYRGIDDKVPSPVYGFVVLVVLVLLCLLVAAIRRGSMGQKMLAVRSNERAAAAAGIDVRRVKLTAFMVSALIAGVCGALYAYNFQTVSSDLFSTVNSLVIIAYAYFGGITMITGALFAGLGATQGLIPQALDTWWGLSGNWALLIGAVGLLVTLVGNPDGVAGTAYWKRRTKAKQRALAAAASGAAPVVDVPPPRAAASAP
ncbi:MAG TPA: ABC transporter permease, partial [Frankiaceae bacterium]|nr:ABC transporter permease [Frankiaceae bacterium]